MVEISASEGGPGPSAPTPRQAAAAAGMLGAATAVVVDVSCSHRVHRVQTPSAACVVKQADDSRAASSRNLAPEAYVYRLTGWIPALASVLPRPRLVDDRRRVLVLEVHDPVVLGGAELAASVGRALATVHSATAGVPLPFPASSGVLDLPDVDASQILLRRDEARRLAAEVAADPLLAGALREGRRMWSPSCLVHADLKWDNVLVARDGSVRLIDWELAGRGDPAWDVAGWVAQGESLGEGAGTEPFVRAYAAVVGAAGSVGAGTFWDRVGLFTAARLLHLWLEHADGGGEVRPGALEAVRELVCRRSQTTARLAGWAA